MKFRIIVVYSIIHHRTSFISLRVSVIISLTIQKIPQRIDLFLMYFYCFFLMTTTLNFSIPKQIDFRARKLNKLKLSLLQRFYYPFVNFLKFAVWFMCILERYVLNKQQTPQAFRINKEVNNHLSTGGDHSARRTVHGWIRTSVAPRREVNNNQKSAPK